MKIKLQHFLFIFVLVSIMFVTNKQEVNAELMMNEYPGFGVVAPLNVMVSGNLTSAVYAYKTPAYGAGMPTTTDLPVPFNEVHFNLSGNTHTFYVAKENSTGNCYLFYCVGYGMPLNNGYTMYENNDAIGVFGRPLTAEEKNIASLVFIYGFDTPSAKSDPLEIRNTPGYVSWNGPRVWATQVAMWIATTGNWGGPDQDRIANSLLDDPNDPTRDAMAEYNIIKTNVDKALKMPSFISSSPDTAQTVELKWNGTRFEARLTDTNEMNTAERVEINYHYDGLNFEKNGNELIIWTNDVIGTKENPVVATAEKVINGGTGVLRIWQSTPGTQPLARNVPLPRTPEVGYLKVCTEGLGNLVIEKKDEHDKYREGAKFKVEGPSGTFYPVTGSDGIARLDNILMGTYTITEIEAPEGAVLNPEVKTVEVTVTPGQTVTFTWSNPYPNGSAQLTKYDADTQGEPKGSATLAGAVYNLYAAEQIKEGPTTIYEANAIVRENLVTNENGETPVVDNLPVGSYYYKEIKPSEGFNINPDRVDFDIEYVDQNTPVIPKVNNIAPEPPIYGNIEIVKKLEGTDYDPETLESGVQFKATYIDEDGNRHEDQVYYSNISGEDGICRIEKVPYGDYIVEQTMVPVDSLKIDDFNVEVTENDYTYKYEKTNPIKKIGIKIRKVDSDREETDDPDYTKGDAELKGAEYTIYRDKELTQVVDVLVVDHQDEEGYWCAQSGTLKCGTYYVKETKAPKGYLPDETIHVYSQEPEDQDIEYVELTKVSKDKIIRGKVQVIKMDNDNDNDDSENDTDKNSATGAELRLALISDPSEFYDVEIDENGYATFVDEDFKKKYPDVEFTIPYGEYEITEIKASDSGENTYYAIQPEKVNINVDGETEERILMDEPVPMYLQVMKMDLEDNRTVALAGAGFKIWSINDGGFVSLYDSSDDKKIDTFYTGENGYFITPEKLYAGEYIVYEVEAPKGYALNEEWKMPTKEDGKTIDESKLGVVGEGGKYVKIDKQALGLANNAEYPGIDVGDLIYEVEMPDKRVKGKIVVYKTGEMLTDVTITSGEYGTEKKPVYDNRGLEGVTYEIYTKEAIVSPDGKETYKEANQKVDTITTDENGYAESKELDLGKYYVKEVSTSDDRVIVNDEPVDVELKYEGQEVPVVTENLELENENKNAKLSFEKIFEESDYIYQIDEEEKYAVFGVYAGHDIKDYKGKVVINNGDLIQTIRTDDKGTVEETLDLPAGDYYYQEIEASPSYTPDENKYNFVIDYEKDVPVIEIEGKDVTNPLEEANLMLLKLSTSTFLDKTGLYGSNDINAEELENLSQQLLDQIRNLSKDELIEYLEENNSNYLLEGAEYSIYLDKDCTTPLKLKDGTEVKITTDEHGLAEVKELPLGVYYLKETKAPVKAELANEVVTIELTTSDLGNELAYRLLFDRVLGFTFEKKDIFTGDLVKDCKFIITDENQEEIASFTTNEKGIAEIPIDMFDQGETYYYQEIEAPDIYKEDGKLYKLNTEPHKFVLDYTIDYEKEEIVWNNENKEVVDNYRPVIKELIVKKTDEETGEPLQGCKFSIVLLDENGEPYVNEAGETVYLVKDAVTDENGEYRVEEPVYGTYKFIEVEAPEGYDLAEQEMEGYEFTINDKTPDTLIFEVTNTGDIAVVAIAVVAVVCIAGIVFVMIRHKKQK